MLDKLYLLKSNKARFNVNEFFYLKNGGDLPESHDVKGFIKVEKRMNKLKFTVEEIDSIWRMLATVLLLGELNYDETSFDDL